MKMISFIMILLLFSTNLVSGKTRIAVTNFKDKSGAGRCKVSWFSGNDLGTGMTDQLITELSQNNRYEIQEREALKEIYSEEHQLINADKSAAPKKNRFKAAHYSIVAAITAFEMCADGVGGSVDVGGLLGFKGSGLNVGGKHTSAKVVLDLRVVDVEKGKVVKSWRSEGKSSSTSFDMKGNYQGSGFGTDVFNSTPIGEATRYALQDVVKKINAVVPDINDPELLSQVSQAPAAIGSQQAAMKPMNRSTGSISGSAEKAAETKSQSTILCPHHGVNFPDSLEMCKPIQKTQAGRYEMLYLSEGSQRILPPTQIKVLTRVTQPTLAQVVYLRSSTLPNTMTAAYPPEKSFQPCKVVDFTNQSASVLCRGRELTVPLSQIYSVGAFPPRAVAGQ